jgi:hypothetical protein
MTRQKIEDELREAIRRARLIGVHQIEVRQWAFESITDQGKREGWEAYQTAARIADAYLMIEEEFGKDGAAC